MVNRAKDWLAQAEHDLELADVARRAGHHGWACFACHQTAEKAVKAVHLHHGQDAWGHVVVTLLEQLPAAVDPELIEKGRVLDTFYIPARYPNSHPAGAPFEHYGPRQSEEAIRFAGEIVRFARSQMAQEA